MSPIESLECCIDEVCKESKILVETKEMLKYQLQIHNRDMANI